MAEDRATELAADLLARGYVEVESHGDLKVGARARHAGQRWPEAFQRGTGIVGRIFHKPDSAWAQKYGRPDVELIFNRDDGTHSTLANYHVDLAWEA